MKLSFHNFSTKLSIENNNGPLSGIRIIDLTRILSGPFCTMILGDLGAEVIKGTGYQMLNIQYHHIACFERVKVNLCYHKTVEKPGTGDDTRSWIPPSVKNQSCYFISVNRNKKSIAIDLTKGQSIICDLVKKSDIIIENFVPGTMEKLGLGYEKLNAINPRIIYSSITGYGTSGPYKNRGGYDVIAASLGGLLHITGPKDGSPCKTGVALTDLACGLYIYGALMAGLIQRNSVCALSRILFFST
jgi:succinate--hydroxymethylglutarate CoA-transferase